VASSQQDRGSSSDLRIRRPPREAHRWSSEETSLPYGTVLHEVRVNGDPGPIHYTSQDQITVECDYTFWGTSTAIVFAVLFYVDRDGEINVVEVVPHGTGNGFPGKRRDLEVNVYVPRGINFFYLGLQAVYTEEQAIERIRDQWDERIKHYGVGFVVVRD
jgi:hypothetical protein